MKKAISVLMALIISLCHLSVISIALYEETDCLSLENFTSKLVALNSGEIFESSFSDNARVYFSDGDEYEETNDNSKTFFRLVAKAECKLDPLDSVGYIYGYNDLHILQFDNKESFDKALAYYASLQCVEYVEEDSVLREAVVDDGNDFVFEAAAEYPTSVQSSIFGYIDAKNNSGGNSVDIAVIDSGIQHDHDFLEGRVVDSGFNAITDNGTAYDDRGHGTHVAGIIVANTLSNVTVHAYKALNESGSGTASQISLAIDAAIEDDVDIINLSLSMKGSSAILHEAVQRAYNAGICVIVAAGNDGIDLTNNHCSPASFSECITVMSCSNIRRILKSSNYGEPCDFAAPGDKILSCDLNNRFKIRTGTSMAAPFICAAASYLLADNDTLSPEEIRTALGQNFEWCYGSSGVKCVYPSAGTSLDGNAPAPEFVFGSGEFIGSITVSFIGAEDIDVFYYLNDDDESYKMYTKPFVISETAKITAFTVQAGKKNSDTVSETYTSMGDSSDFIVENGTLVSYTGTQSSVIVPLSVYGENIYRIGERAFAGNETITSVSLGRSVTEICKNAFADCTNLETVTSLALKTVNECAFDSCKNLMSFSAASLENIGASAFKDCSELSVFDFSNVKTIGDKSFINTSDLYNFDAPLIERVGESAFLNSGLNFATLSNASEICSNAFANCTNLSSIIINASQIGEGVFQGCSNLKEVVADNLTVIPKNSFKKCFAFNKYSFSNIEAVEESAFENCSSIDILNIENLKTINDRAFANCSVKQIIGNNVKDISDTAFVGCLNISLLDFPNLESVDLSCFKDSSGIISMNFSLADKIIFPENGLSTFFPKIETFYADSILELPDNAFNDCNNLKYCSLEKVSFVASTTFFSCPAILTIKLNSVEEIDITTFNKCTNLTTLWLNSLKEIPVNETGSAFTGLLKLTEVHGDALTTIPDVAFKNCSALRTVSFENVTSIGKSAFAFTGLKKAVFNSVDKIEPYAFYEAKSLNYVRFGNITEVNNSVFEGCVNLEYFYYSGDTLELRDRAFYNCSNFSPLTSLRVSSLSHASISGTLAKSFLELPELKIVNDGGFLGTDIKTIVLENVEYIYSIPGKCRVLIGTDVIDSKFNNSSTSTIYAPANSFVSGYCIENNINYIEFDESSMMLRDVDLNLQSQSDSPLFTAIGFNLEYHWYGCNNIDRSDSVAVYSGKNSFYPLKLDYAPDTYKYFYCVATSTENGNIVSTSSRLCFNIIANFKTTSDKTTINYFTTELYSDDLNSEEFINSLVYTEDCCEFVPSYSYNDCKFYGTGSQIKFYNEGALVHSYVLYLKGDVNGDGYIDVLDCTTVAKAANGLVEITDQNYYKASSVFDGDLKGISAQDYQAVVNKAVS